MDYLTMGNNALYVPISPSCFTCDRFIVTICGIYHPPPPATPPEPTPPPVTPPRPPAPWNPCTCFNGIALMG